MNINRLAIVIANYNGYDDTVRCLSSLEKSSFKDFFVVLVDDCSVSNRDEIKNLSFSGSKLIICSSSENLGFAGANNIGIKKALEYEPEYIMLLNNDTCIFEDSLLKLMKHASEDTIITPKILAMKDTSILYSAGGRINKSLMIPENIGAGCKDSELFDDIAVCDYVSFCCAVIPTKIINEIGLLDEGYYMYSEDVDYCMRLAKAGYTCRYIPDSRILHRDGGTGVGRSQLGTYYGIRNECYIRERYLEGGAKYNKKLYNKVKREFLFRKLIHREHPDNTICYKAMSAFMNGEMGRR